MYHRNRVHGVVPVESAEKLAESLTGMTWVLCQGFEFDGYLYLNDATHEDGAGEWAVYRKSDLVQVESITFGWMNAERALDYIKKVSAGEYQPFSTGSRRPDLVQYGEAHGRCELCA